MSKKKEVHLVEGKPYVFTPKTTIGEMVKCYPGIRLWLPTLSPSCKQLSNPVAFKVMSGIATLEMAAQRGGFSVEELIEHLNSWVSNQQN